METSQKNANFHHGRQIKYGCRVVGKMTQCYIYLGISQGELAANACNFVQLTGGDLIAQEAKYHLSCLAQLYRRRESALKESEGQGGQTFHSLAFAALLSMLKNTEFPVTQSL